MEQDWSVEGAAPISSLAREASDPQSAPERLVELSAIPEIRPLVAANVGTPAACLEALSEDGDVQVRLAVTQNSNTALPCLLKLAREFPEAFFLNPLCKLLDLADPGWYARIDDQTWLYLLKSAELPRHWLAWVEERHRASLPSGQANPRPVVLSLWIAARLHVAMPELHTRGEHIGRDLAGEISIVARHERTPAPLLAELASIVCQFASLEEIGSAVCDQIPRVVAENVQAPEGILRQLARAEDPKVRYRVGRNPRAPVDVLEQLITDTAAYVKIGVIMNPALPSELLKRFAGENGYAETLEPGEQQNRGQGGSKTQEGGNNQKLFMEALAGAEGTPANVLRRLASHMETSVRVRLASNQAVPADVLLSMVSDVDQVLFTMVTENARVPVEALAQLAGHKNNRVRIAVAKHPRTPGKVLALLARDSHLRVREAVAKHPSTPVEALAKLAQEGVNARTLTTAVRSAVALNPVTPQKLLMRLANQSSREVHLALAKNARLPVALINQLLADGNQSVCLQIASHPHISQEGLERLAQHPSQQVAELAQKRLALWRALGSRGEQEYAYRVDLEENRKAGMGEGVLASMPLYEIQRRAQELLNPRALPAFLARFQLPPAERQDLLVALLPELSRKWKNHSNAWVGLFEAFALPVEWQRFFAASPWWLVRYALALKPEVETAVLEMLVDDGNRYVRAAARWYLQERQDRE